MAAKIPSYMTRVSQLNGAKALARRHPGMAQAIRTYVRAEEAALDLTGKNLEGLVRLGIGDYSVSWGPRPDWSNDLSSGQVWISRLGYGEHRLGITSEESGGYGLVFCFEDREQAWKRLKTAKALVAAVERFARG